MTPQHHFHQPTRATGPHQRQRSHGLGRQRSVPLTEDQYVATSLALVAQLSQRVRDGAARQQG